VAEAAVWVGVKDVEVHPDGQAHISLTPVTDDGVELEVTVEDIVLKAADGLYDQTVVSTHISYQLTIRTKEVHLADQIVSYGVNTGFTVKWTLIAAGGASTDREYSLDCKLMNEPNPAGNDGMNPTQCELVFRGISTDGSSTPLTRPSEYDA